MLMAVKQNGETLQYASATLKNDREIVELVDGEQYDTFRPRSETTGNSCWKLSRRAGVCWNTSAALKDDREVVLEAVKQNGNDWNTPPPRQGDREIVLASLATSRCVSRCAPMCLRCADAHRLY